MGPTRAKAREAAPAVVPSIMGQASEQLIELLLLMVLMLLLPNTTAEDPELQVTLLLLKLRLLLAMQQVKARLEEAQVMCQTTQAMISRR